MIVAATDEDIATVCANLRDDDRREVMLTRWSDSTDDLASAIMRVSGGRFAARWRGRPVAVFGVTPSTPGVGQGWLIGTDEIGRCGIEIAHACRKIARTLLAGDTNRIHSFSAVFHVEAHAWLEAIGAVRESTLRAYGKDGTDFYCYAMTK